MHDELGQALTALRMMVVWVRERTGDVDSELTAKLERMSELLRETIASMRRIASELRPLILDDLGLVPAIETLVERFSDRTGIACQLTANDIGLPLVDPYKTAVFRIVQESLTNIAKHAQATHVEVVIAEVDGEIAITVTDDGIGFAVGGPRSQGSRGLLGMRERAYLLGGRLDIVSDFGKGTLLEIRLPVTPEEATS